MNYEAVSNVTFVFLNGKIEYTIGNGVYPRMPRDYFKMTLEARLLAKHGQRLTEVLRDLYIVQRLPLRETMRALGCNSLKATSTLLEKYGVPVRRGSAAVANQWARNPRRVADVSGLLKRAERGEHWALGLSKETDPRLASISSKLRTSRRLLQRDVLARAAASRHRKLLENPASHPQARMKPTRIETMFAVWLQSCGWRYEFNQPFVVSDRVIFIDFVLPEQGIGIECSKLLERFTADRARLIIAAGLVPLGVPNTRIKSGDLGRVYEAIAKIHLGQWSPATLRECWMASRSGQLSARSKAELDQPLW